MTSDPFASEFDGGDDFSGSTEGADGAQFEGPHLVRCISVKEDESQAGNPMFVFDFEVVMDANKDTTNAGETLLVFAAKTKAAAWKMKETLIALGVMDVDDDDYRFSRRDVIGVYAIAEVAINEYQGRKRPQIEGLRAHSLTKKGSPYRGSSQQPDAAPAPEQPAADAPAPPGGDEIPF